MYHSVISCSLIYMLGVFYSLESAVTFQGFMFVECISSRNIYKYMTYPVLSWWNRVMWFLHPVVKVIPQIAFPEMLFVLITVIFKFEFCWGNNLNRIIKVERKVWLLLLWSNKVNHVSGGCWTLPRLSVVSDLVWDIMGRMSRYSQA